MLKCDHCLLEFPDREAVYDESNGAKKIFCCHGCQGVYHLINSEGLDDFYRRRREWTPGPSPTARVDLAAFTQNIRSAGKELETDIVLDGRQRALPLPGSTTQRTARGYAGIPGKPVSERSSPVSPLSGIRRNRLSQRHLMKSSGKKHETCFSG
jgi:Putative metal-binding domain of cation transport ATPase